MEDSDYLALWIHQSKLMWSRLQTLTVVNFAVFGAWWKFEIKEILWFGALFNVLILFAIIRDSNYMSYLIDELKVIPKVPRKLTFGGVQIACVSPLTLGCLCIFLATPYAPRASDLKKKMEPAREKIKLLESMSEDIKVMKESLGRVELRRESQLKIHSEVDYRISNSKPEELPPQ